jgi:hypothetical protein
MDETVMGNGEKTYMDGGPFRSQQPPDRRVVSGRPERRQPEEPQPVIAEPKPVYRSAASTNYVEKEDKKLNKFKFPLIAVVVAIILGIAGWFAWSSIQNGNTAIDSGKYQAVFFTNGQVYFGKLKSFNGEYMQLTDIYYLQTQSSDDDNDNPQQTSNDQNDVQLIKLGDEIHGPEDQMIISKDQMLFYENLKTDSKVAQSIAQYKAK